MREQLQERASGRTIARNFDVALIVESSTMHGRNLLRGIMDYAREQGRWTLRYCEQSRYIDPPAWLAGWRGNGIIARIENAGIAAAVSASGLPAVDLSAARLIPSIPMVETDDKAIAGLVADHLIERGLRHFAYFGVRSFNWSKFRHRYFREAVARHGFVCQDFVDHAPGDPRAEQRGLVRWLRNLPKPIGIMTSHDIRAQQLLEACRSDDICVPDEVAVASVDNDDLLCSLASPPLTSVVLNSRQMGYLAARLLDRAMARQPVSPEVYLVPPSGLVARQSTDISLIEDADVVRALQFMNRHALNGMGVEDVMHEVGVNRRVFERRFRAAVGRTPHKHLVKLRMEKVRCLLLDSDLPLHRIAEQTGFEHPEYLSVAFKRQFGIWPSDYRARFRDPALLADDQPSQVAVRA